MARGPKEYSEHGAELGWLLDPMDKRVHVYQPGTAVEVLDIPTLLSGEPLLRGFVLDVPQNGTAEPNGRLA